MKNKLCDQLPEVMRCYSPNDDLCTGPIDWEHRPFKPKERKKLRCRFLPECPWQKQAEDWLKRKGFDLQKIKTERKDAA